MKKILFIVALGCTLMACHSELDLGKVDTSMEVNMGLTLPVGSIKMMLTDMIGEVDGLYIDTLKNQGVLTWRYDTTTSRDYHQMDLAKNFDTITVGLKVYDQIAAQVPAYLLGGPVVTPVELKFALDFPIDLPLKEINKDKTVNERLDRALIDSASFYSILRPENLPFEWAWVDSVVLNLGPRFERKAPLTNLVEIYTKGSGSSYDSFGDSIPITVDDFTLNMMKNQHPSNPVEYKYENVYDVCSFSVRLKFTIPAGSTISITTDSKINYKLGVKFLDFSAIWGMFAPSEAMSGNDVIDMSDAWKSFDFLTKATMPFSEPVMKTQIVTQIAGALRLKNSYIFTLDANNDTTYAEFDEVGDANSKWFSKAFDEHEYLPLESAIGDSATKMFVTFDNTVKGGQIHRMFRKTPQKLGYTFAVKFDEMETPQIRITPNTFIRIKSTFTLPFIFDKGIWIEYPESSEVSMSQFSIDSLQHEAEAIDTIKSAKVKLVMKALNAIPLNLKYTLRCQDENGNIIKDPLDKTKDFLLFTQDTITLAPPTFSFNASAGGWVPTPQESTFIVDLTKEQLNMFPKIKKIVYTAVLDDDALKDAYAKGLTNVRLTNEDYVTMKIGLAASVEGIFNFGKDNK